jgi:hypothetical protein
MLIVGERHLPTVLAEYGADYNGRRPHRALELLPLRSDPIIPPQISATSRSGVDRSLEA